MNTPKPRGIRRKPQPKTPKITQNELVQRLRARGFGLESAKRHLTKEAGVHRTLVASGNNVSVEQLERALKKIISDANAHDKIVAQRARERWDV